MSQKPIIITVLVIAIAAIAGGAFYVQQNETNGNKATSNNSTSSTTESGSPDAVETDTVEISNFAYSPKVIEVKVGTTVTWTNKDGVKHDVKSDNGNTLDGPLLAKGETWSYTFEEAGTFDYHCSPHPYMKGSVIVTE